MKANEIYIKAINNGITFECDCTGIRIEKWEQLMKGATRANKKIVDNLVKDNTEGEFNDFIQFYNPYDHYKTNTHIIFVHSCIEHFFKIN